MTSESFKKAKAINSEISTLQEKLRKLEKVKKGVDSGDGLFVSSYCSNVIFSKISKNSEEAIAFNTAYTLIKTALESHISALKKEFEKL